MSRQENEEEGARMTLTAGQIGHHTAFDQILKDDCDQLVPKNGRISPIGPTAARIKARLQNRADTQCIQTVHDGRCLRATCCDRPLPLTTPEAGGAATHRRSRVIIRPAVNELEHLVKHEPLINFGDCGKKIRQRTSELHSPSSMLYRCRVAIRVGMDRATEPSTLKPAKSITRFRKSGGQLIGLPSGI